MTFDPNQARAKTGEWTKQYRADAGTDLLEAPHEENEPIVAVYDLDASLIDDAKKAIERANARLERNGIDDRFTAEYETYTRKVTNANYTTTVQNRVKITMNRPTISYNGFEFMARVEQLDNGEFMAYSAPGQEMNGWRPESMECDHCGKTRARSKVYVVRDENGEYKTVGGQCVELYTGMKPGGLSALEWSGLDDLEERSESMGGSSARIEYDSENILRIAYVVTKETGYRNAQSDAPTRNIINSVLSPNPRDREAQEFSRQVQAQAYSEDVDISTIRADIEAGLEGNDSDWAHNVRSLMNNETIDSRAISTLASAMSILHKYRAQQRQKASWASGYLGKEKDKLTGVKAKIISKTYSTSYYGYDEKTVMRSSPLS